MGLVRENCSIIVCESQTVGSIGVIRSLGMIGYKVLACSPKPDALGFKSRYVKKILVCPEYSNTDEFLAWLDHTLENHDVDCIIPSEGFLLAARPRFQKIRHLLPFNQKEKDVYSGMSKYDLFDSFDGPNIDPKLSEHLPVFHKFGSSNESDFNVSEFPFPVYLKTDGTYSKTGEYGNVSVSENLSELNIQMEKARKEFSSFLLQGHAKGVGVGVFVLRWEGRVYASFMHRRIHEVPHTGGASSLRESWWNQVVYDDAIARFEAMDWQGVGMLEYRWDQATGDFVLLEFNARFWGSLHLALYAGVDFPALLADAFFGHPRESGTSVAGIKCRLTFPKEIQYVWSCLKDKNLGVRKKLWVIFEFFLLSADLRVKSDMLYGNDWRLYMPMFLRSMRSFIK